MNVYLGLVSVFWTITSFEGQALANTSIPCPPPACDNLMWSSTTWSTTFQQSCYYVVKDVTTRANNVHKHTTKVVLDFSMSLEACRCYGGYPPIIDDGDENEFLSHFNGSNFGYLHKPNKKLPLGGILLGMNTDKKTWQDGTPISYLPDKWHDKQFTGCTVLGIRVDFADLGIVGQRPYAPGHWFTMSECESLIPAGILCETNYASKISPTPSPNRSDTTRSSVHISSSISTLVSALVLALPLLLQ